MASFDRHSRAFCCCRILNLIPLLSLVVLGCYFIDRGVLNEFFKQRRETNADETTELVDISILGSKCIDLANNIKKFSQKVNIEYVFPI